MKRMITAVLALVLCMTMLLPLNALAAENPVPAAKKAVVCIMAGIKYNEAGQIENVEEGAGTGTGFGVGVSGSAQTFVTNCHVVSNQQDQVFSGVYVCIDGANFEDESTLIRAKVLYADPTVDLAIIQTEKPVSGVATLPLLPSETMETGDRVYAMGFPGIADAIADTNNYTVKDITVTDGVLSRYITSDGIKEIAHTAEINSGNSGGPLINEKGQVVGINTEILYYTNQGAAPDLRGYAIYIDYAMEALDQLGIAYTDASKVTEEEKTASKMNPGLILGVAAAAVVLVVVVVLIKKKGGKAAYTVYAVAGPLQGMSWPLKKAVTVGRDPSGSIVYPAGSNGVSRNHCRIEVKGSQVTVTDLGSSYGTYIGGRRISPNVPVAIQKNTEICIGGEHIRLMLR